MRAVVDTLAELEAHLEDETRSAGTLAVMVHKAVVDLTVAAEYMLAATTDVVDDGQHADPQHEAQYCLA